MANLGVPGSVPRWIRVTTMEKEQRRDIQLTDEGTAEMICSEPQRMTPIGGSPVAESEVDS
jgi:hypothetical protein